MALMTWEDLAGQDASFFMNICSVDGDGGWHGHHFLELAYVQSGRVRHLCNGHACMVEAGSYFLVDATVTHAYQCLDGPAVIVNMIFRPAFLDASLQGCRSLDAVLRSYLLHFSERFQYRPYSGVPFRDPGAEVARLLARMWREYRQDGAGRVPMLRACLIEVLVLTMRQLTPAGVDEPDEDVRAVCAAVDAHAGEALSLHSLAVQRHVSLSYLSRRFEQIMGCGFKTYLQTRRIEEACRLLANSERKITDIAAAVGYRDMKFFGALFRRLTDLSPSEYRAQTRH